MKILLIIIFLKITFSSENESWKEISTKNSCDNYLIVNFMVFLYAYGKYEKFKLILKKNIKSLIFQILWKFTSQ